MHARVSKRGEAARLHVLTANNMISAYDVILAEKGAEANQAVRLDHHGHRSDVRTVAFSSDNTAVLSGSHETVKIWSRSEQVR